MNNILVLPMVIPLLTGILLVFLKRFIHVQRWLSVGAMIVNAIISLVILNRIQAEGILRLDFGEWLPPYGILFLPFSFAPFFFLTTIFFELFCLGKHWLSVGAFICHSIINLFNLN